MAFPRKNYISKQDLIDNKVTVTFDENNQPVITQEYIQNANHDRSGKWKTVRPINLITAKHEYGKDKCYKTVSIKLYGAVKVFTVSTVVWVYFNDTIPVGYEVDHINDDGLDNRLENLQLLDMKENNAKRRYRGANQYMNSSQFESPEEYFKERERKQMERLQAKNERMQARLEKNAKLLNIESQIADKKQMIADYEIIIKQLRTEWHDLCAERENVKKGIA